MRQSRANAAKTRASVLEAALCEFAHHGVAATTLSKIAAVADVTRGAVYWHFDGKDALVHDLLQRLTWPLDVGADLSLYMTHPDPLQLLTQTLWTQLQSSMQDHSQWQILKILLRHDEQSSMSSEATQKIVAATAQSVQRIAAVLSIVLERGGLHYGLTPIEIAYCVHAFGIGILCEHLHIPTRSLHQHSSLSLEMLFNGIRQPERCLQRD